MAGARISGKREVERPETLKVCGGERRSLSASERITAMAK